MRNTTKLRTQLIAVLLIAILVPVAAISGYNLYNTNKILTSESEKSALNNLDWVIKNIGDIYRENSNSISMLSLDPNAGAIFKNPDSEKWLMMSFESFANTHKGVKSVYYGIKDRRMLLIPKEELPAGYDPTGRDWYKLAIANKGNVAVTNPYEDAVQKGNYVITFSKTVNDQENGEVLGVVGIDIALSALSDIISKIKIGEEGYVALIDNSGRIISHKDSKFLGKEAKDEPWIEHIASSKETEGSSTINGEKYITYSKVEENTKWKVVAFVPEKEITSELKGQRNVAVAVSLAFLVLASIAGILFSNSITRPIIKLVGILDKVREGDFTVSVSRERGVSKEIDIISQSINRLIGDMVSILKNILDTSKGIKDSSESLVSITQQSSAIGEEVSKAVQQISEGAQDQASSLDESSIIVGSLGEEVNRAINNSNSMLSASGNVKESTTQGTLIVEKLKETFSESSNASKELQQGIRILAENSNKISAITDTIKAITEQTSLLALNASIEAARAGEAGRGFAVVADEVRKLAEQSSSSAEDINMVINEIKGSVNAVLQKIQLSIDLNEKSEKSVEVTNTSFKKIEQSIGMLEETINTVSGSLKIIDKSKEEVIQRISEIATVAQETAATTEEVNASSEEQSAGLHEVVGSAENLSSLAEKLDEMVKRFKI